MKRGKAPTPAVVVGVQGERVFIPGGRVEGGAAMFDQGAGGRGPRAWLEGAFKDGEWLRQTEEDSGE